MQCISSVRIVRTSSCAEVAQLVEQLIRNEQVVGSSPIFGSKIMPVLAIEAPLDGIGKTTIAREVAARLGGVVITDTPIDGSWHEERRAVNAGTDVDARFQYFRRLNGHYMDLARAEAEQGNLAILDSSVYRTVATHRVLRSVQAAAYLLEPSLTPDVTALLVTDDRTRMNRLIRRDGDIVFSSHWDRTLSERYADITLEYDRFGLPLVEATVSVDEVAKQVITLYGKAVD